MKDFNEKILCSLFEWFAMLLDKEKGRLSTIVEINVLSCFFVKKLMILCGIINYFSDKIDFVIFIVSKRLVDVVEGTSIAKAYISLFVI